MSDENTEQSVETGASPESNSIPKYRLDEEIEKRKKAEEEIAFLRQMASRQVPGQQLQQKPRPEPKHMQELREQNPQAYIALKQQEVQLKQLNAAQFDMYEAMDRKSLVEEFGDDARKYGNQIENELKGLRERGRFDYNRAQIYKFLKGEETIKREQSPVVRTPAAPQLQSQSTAPSQSARSVDTMMTGSAPASTGSKKTLEQMEQELEGVEF